MIQNFTSLLIGSIQFGYPVVLFVLLILYIVKIKIKRVDHILVLQIINIIAAIFALVNLIMNYEIIFLGFDQNIINNVNPRNGNSSVLKIVVFIFILCNMLLPQLFWVKNIRNKVLVSFFIMILMYCNSILEYYAIIIASYHRDISSQSNYFVIYTNSLILNLFYELLTYLSLISVIYVIIIKSARYKSK